MSLADPDQTSYEVQDEWEDLVKVDYNLTAITDVDWGTSPGGQGIRTTAPPAGGLARNEIAECIYGMMAANIVDTQNTDNPNPGYFTFEAEFGRWPQTYSVETTGLEGPDYPDGFFSGAAQHYEHDDLMLWVQIFGNNGFENVTDGLGGGGAYNGDTTDRRNFIKEFGGGPLFHHDEEVATMMGINAHTDLGTKNFQGDVKVKTVWRLYELEEQEMRRLRSD